MKRLSIAVAFASIALAQHPYPQPTPGPSVQTVSADGVTTFVVTGKGPLEVGKNFLLTVDSNMFDSAGKEMVNTEPSRPSVPYNLMDGAVVSVTIDATSPSDDLRAIFAKVLAAARAGGVDAPSIQMGLDILEGNPIPSRPTYSGLPVLHYTGPEKVKKIMPVVDQIGKEMGLAAIFNKFESGLIYASDAIDITDVVIKRFNDAQGAPAAQPAKK